MSTDTFVTEVPREDCRTGRVVNITFRPQTVSGVIKRQLETKRDFNSTCAVKSKAKPRQRFILVSLALNSFVWAVGFWLSRTIIEVVSCRHSFSPRRVHILTHCKIIIITIWSSIVVYEAWNVLLLCLCRALYLITIIILFFFFSTCGVSISSATLDLIGLEPCLVFATQETSYMVPHNKKWSLQFRDWKLLLLLKCRGS